MSDVDRYSYAENSQRKSKKLKKRKKQRPETGNYLIYYIQLHNIIIYYKPISYFYDNNIPKSFLIYSNELCEDNSFGNGL